MLGRYNRDDFLGSDGLFDDLRMSRSNRGDGNVDLAIEHHGSNRLGVAGAQSWMNIRMETDERLEHARQKKRRRAGRASHPERAGTRMSDAIQKSTAQL